MSSELSHEQDSRHNHNSCNCNRIVRGQAGDTEDAVGEIQSKYHLNILLCTGSAARVAISGTLSGRKRRIVRDACRADSQSLELCCIAPAGTGEGISARIHGANSHGDKAEEGRRSARRQNENSLGVRVESCVMMVTGNVV